MLVQVVQDDLGDRVPLQDDDQALPRTRGGLVADVLDAADLAVLDQVGDFLREVVGVGLVRQLRDDQALTALDLLDRTTARIVIEPRPVRYASTMPLRPTTSAPVGK
ncbi:hypothetical protein SBADM41S_00618 [Streptomyces badius]